MAYSEKVIDHYNEPRNVGSFTKEEDGVGTRARWCSRVWRRNEASNQGRK